MQRFLDKIDKTNDCWNWTAAIRGKSGYGCFKFENKTIDAHRFSWILHNGEIPKNLFVCHKCDNRKCVNPEHLFLGTQSDNMKDCFNKNRLTIPINLNKRKSPKNCLITKQRAIEVKNILLNKGNKKLKDIAIELNLPYQLIRDLNCNRVYV